MMMLRGLGLLIVGAAHDMLTVVAVIVPNKTFVGASGANKVR